MLKEIKEKALELVEKKNQIKKGLQDFLKAINIDTDIEDELLVQTKIVRVEYEDKDVDYFLRFTGKEFKIYEKVDSYIYKVDVGHLPITVVQKIIENLPNALTEMKKQLDELNNSYDKVMVKLKQLIEKVNN